jgi:hypothetical protein
MSTSHATLHRIFDAWSVEDTGSRNGTLVNGRAIRRERLADGDWIEVGHTFLLFRESVLLAPDGSRVLDAADLRPAAAGLATLQPSLAAGFRQLEVVARSSISVVIRGETGTGKEVVASALHALSGRQGPFQALNCGALSSPSVQAELFGQQKGMAGAAEDSPGLIRAAAGGTLFLDKIDDLSLPAQALLLRVLQAGEVLPVGAARPVQVDVRVVATTQRDLQALAAENRFRTDLLARLAGFTLALPALRERREDLGLLLAAFLRRQAADARVSFSSEAARAMLLYSWPLNVRELEKALQAAVVLAKDGKVELDHLPPPVRGALRSTTAAAPVRIETEGTRPEEARPAPPASKLQRFLDEISRRHVVRVVVAYAVAVFGALQGADIIVTRLELPPRWMVWLVIACLAGLPLTAVLSWVYDWTRAGIVRTAPLAPNQTVPARVRRWQWRGLVLALCVLGLLVAASIGLLLHGRP